MTVTEAVQDDYRITKDTMALLPSYQDGSRTLVYETTKRIYVNQTSKEIVNNGCLEGFSSYDGRRMAAIYQTGKNYNVPIAINPYKNIFAFPTNSPSNYDCIWLFYHHIQDISSAKNNPKHSIVTMSDNAHILVPVSSFTLKKKMYLTSHCVLCCQQIWDNNKEAK
ncbi:competence protein [Salipaludibacillus keqinensis]|uniref:Competence protein n=1 Tax=Salipaludibacillus keqinensis TaxID=2045207 RepID=A0A323TK06_9BACI|nr:competence protein ComK [Salipaludibacillus keqinensis]PYZ94910.1 competence protein [Salipaludibacillus keqinensis]